MPLRSELHRVACTMVVSLALGCQAPNPNFALGTGGGDGRLDTPTDLSGGGGAGGTSGGSGGVIGGQGGQGGFLWGTGGSGAGQGGNAAGTGGGGGALPPDAPQADRGGEGEASDDLAPPMESGSSPDSAADTTTADLAPPPADAAPDLASVDTMPDSGPPPDSAPPPQEGLWAYYYSDRNQTMLFAGPLLDMTVDHNWAGGPPLAGMSSDNFAVKWIGVLVPKISGTYTFYTNSDDGARFKLGTETLIDKYVTQGLSEWPSYRSVPLTAGVRYPIVAEYFDGTFTARMHLSWAAPAAGVAKEIIPRSVLFTY